MASRERPLSPFMLGPYYRLQLTSVMSISHRITGIAIVPAALALVWWLVAAATGGDAYATFAAAAASPIGLVAAFGFSLCFAYHFWNGIRHLLWDTGWGFDIPHVYATGWAVLALTVLSTVALWWLAYAGGAA